MQSKMAIGSQEWRDAAARVVRRARRTAGREFAQQVSDDLRTVQRRYLANYEELLTSLETKR